MMMSTGERILSQEREVYGMLKNESIRIVSLSGGLIVSALLLALSGCSSDQPKPPPQPTPDQVRGHGDRTFDKLKQEEQERAAQPSVPR